jgi:hypothetical protein
MATIHITIDSMIFRFLSLLLTYVYLAAPEASAASGQGGQDHTPNLALTLYSTHYTQQRSSTGIAPVGLAHTLGGELTLRVRDWFSLGFMSAQGEKDVYNMYGVGGKVDAPGFFFIGGNDRQSGHQSGYHNRIINTTLFSYIVRQETATRGVVMGERFYGSNSGLGVDIALGIPTFYFSSQVSGLAIQDNIYIVYSLGLGFQI